jgi:hypothetical protein
MAQPFANLTSKNRRSLGRNRTSAVPPAIPTITSTGTTNLTITFNVPVVVRGTIGTTVATRTLVSQTVVSPTVITQVWSGNVATLAYTLPANQANVRTSLGGLTAGVAGTFP